jgi:hypothetical protein
VTDVTEVRTASIKAVNRTSETSVNFNVTTRRYIPEDSINFLIVMVDLIFK